MSRNSAILAGILGLAVVTGVLHFAHVEPVAVFLIAGGYLNQKKESLHENVRRDSLIK